MADEDLLREVGQARARLREARVKYPLMERRPKESEFAKVETAARDLQRIAREVCELGTTSMVAGSFDQAEGVPLFPELQRLHALGAGLELAVSQARENARLLKPWLARLGRRPNLAEFHAVLTLGDLFRRATGRAPSRSNGAARKSRQLERPSFERFLRAALGKDAPPALSHLVARAQRWHRANPGPFDRDRLPLA